MKTVDGKVPAWELAGFVAGYVGVALEEEMHAPGALGELAEDAEAVADVALELAYDEMVELCGREIADRVLNLASTKHLARALAAHAIETGGLA